MTGVQTCALPIFSLLGNGPLNKETGERLSFSVKKGDTVLFGSYAGTEVKISDETYLIMTEEDILGVIE